MSPQPAKLQTQSLPLGDIGHKKKHVTQMCVARLSVSLHVQLGSWPMGFLFSFLLKIRAQKRPMQWQQITGRSLKAHFTSRPALCHFLCITFEAGFLLCVFIFYFIYVPDTKDTFLF